jgi:hypothetical protein
MHRTWRVIFGRAALKAALGKVVATDMWFEFTADFGLKKIVSSEKLGLRAAQQISWTTKFVDLANAPAVSGSSFWVAVPRSCGRIFQSLPRTIGIESRQQLFLAGCIYYT